MDTKSRKILALLLPLVLGSLLVFSWTGGLLGGGEEELLEPVPEPLGSLKANSPEEAQLEAKPKSEGPSRRETNQDPTACVVKGQVFQAGSRRPAPFVEVVALDRPSAFQQIELRIRDLLTRGFFESRDVPIPMVLARTRADAQGRFELRGLPAGRVYLDARSDRWYSRSQRAARVARGEQKNGVQLFVSPGARVFGTVRDPRGDPLPGARVVLRPDANAFLARLSERSYRWVETLSDSEGHYSLPGIPPGRGYALTALHPEMAPAQRRDLEILPGHALQVDLRGTRGGVIRGRVLREGGEPAPFVRVGFAYLDLARILFSVHGGNPVRSDAEGRFELHGVGAGLVAVTALQEGYAPPDPKTLLIVEGGSQTLDLVLGKGWSLKGRVVDENGKAMAGVSVVARNFEQPRGLDLGMLARLYPVRTTTGRDGSFVIRGLSSTRVFVEARKRGYFPGRASRRKEQGGQLLQLILGRGGFIQGKVTGKDGIPLERFSVLALPKKGRRLRIGPEWGRPPRKGNPYVDRSPWLGRQVKELKDPQGRFVLGPFPYGNIQITVYAPGYLRMSREVELGKGKKLPELAFPLQPGARLRGKVLAGGKPLSEAQVTWRRFHAPRGPSFLPFRFEGEPEDLDLMGLSSSLSHRSVLTDEEGRFFLDGVEPGEIRVTARHPDWAKRSLGPISVQAGKERGDLVLEMMQGGGIEGRVLGLSGQGQSGAMVVAASIARGALKATTTKKDGSFQIHALPPGPYLVFKTRIDATRTDLWAQVVGNVRLRAATVREGKITRVLIEDRSEGGVDLYGKITASGKPAPGAVLTLLGQDKKGPLGIGVRSATADAQGNYRLPSVVPGQYLARITNYTRSRPVGAQVAVEVRKGLRRQRLDLRFPDAEIFGRIVDPEGKGVPGVRIRAISEDRRLRGIGLVGMIAGNAGADRDRSAGDGSFHLNRLAPGSWTVSAEPRGNLANRFSSAERTGLVLREGQKLEGIRIVLPRATVLEGEVVDGFGRPVAGARVSLHPQDPEKDPTALAEAALRGKAPARALAASFRKQGRSDGKGFFRIRGLPPGAYQISVEHPKLVNPKPVPVLLRLGSPTKVRIPVVRGGHVRVRVLGWDGRTLPRGKVQVLNSEGKEVGRRNLFSLLRGLFGGDKKSREESRWIDCGILPPDRYTLVVHQKSKDGKTQIRKLSRVLHEGEDARWEIQAEDLQGKK
ncbi:MAG TPA: carboxypeptidase regulatory-like domain-containing protein [Planctomycetes bacterium]|nr:carboxypeptidase regulatory-like domain-containing protein [Planctomycetota bacterium]